jgi:hypothetical protein
MAQIIKHRRGSIDALASATAKKGELIMATGSVGNMQGPWIFVGETEGSAGAFRGLSKIYQGSAAPDLTVGTWGSTLNGTPFYGTTNKSLHILSNSGNITMDLTGNIEGNVISGVTINNLTGTTIDISSDLTVGGDFYITGNTIQTGSIFLTGDIIMSGNINIGDNLTGDTINFNGEVSSSIIPAVNNSFDLGSSTNAWRDLHVSGTAYIEHISLAGISVQNIDLPGDLTVSGTTTLSGSVLVEDLTEKRLVVVGVDGLLTDYSGLTFDNGNLNVSGALEVTNIQGTGSLYLKGDKNDSRYFEIYNTATVDTHIKSNGGMSFFGDDINYLKIDDSLQTATIVGVNGVIVSSSLQVTGSIYNDQLTNNRIVVVGTDGLLEDDTNFTFDGTTLNVGQGNFEVDTDGDIRTSGSLTVDGITQLNGDLTVSGNFTVLGSATEVHISSSVIELDDNIIRLNAYSPFERYAGFEVIDSGSSGVSASMVWDSQNDYWLFVSSSGQSSKFIGTTAGTYGSEISLTDTYFPIATGPNTIGDSLLRYSGTTLSFNTNKFTIDSGTGNTTISGGVTLSYSGGTDNGNNTSGIVFRNSNNVLGFVTTTETEDVLDGILGYKNSDGGLVFSTVIDGGTY